MESYTSIQEYFEELRKNLIDSTAFDLNGSYDWHEKNCSFSGRIDVDMNYKLLGFIDLEPDSICATSILTGKIGFERNFNKIVPVMNFMKRYTNTHLSDVFYNLKKTDGSKEIFGSYEGEWSWKETAIINIDKSAEAIMKLKRGEQLTKDFFEKKTNGKAGLTLIKK